MVSAAIALQGRQVMSLDIFSRGDGTTRESCNWLGLQCLDKLQSFSDGGTRCGSWAFMRAAVMFQTRASMSISSQVAPRTSPLRLAVRIRKSKATRVLSPSSGFERFAVTNFGTRCQGMAGWCSGLLDCLGRRWSTKVTGFEVMWPGAHAHCMTARIHLTADADRFYASVAPDKTPEEVFEMLTEMAMQATIKK
jgi:hypothetical protein